MKTQVYKRIDPLVQMAISAVTDSETPPGEDFDISGAMLARARLEKAIMTRAILFRVDFTKANLVGADLSEADLTEADLSGADLCGANLSGAELTDAILERTNLSRVRGLTQTMLGAAAATAPPVGLPEGLKWPFEQTMQDTDGLASWALHEPDDQTKGPVTQP